MRRSKSAALVCVLLNNGCGVEVIQLQRMYVCIVCIWVCICVYVYCIWNERRNEVGCSVKSCDCDGDRSGMWVGIWIDNSFILTMLQIKILWNLNKMHEFIYWICYIRWAWYCVLVWLICTLKLDLRYNLRACCIY